jgi:hypothetical protein
LVEEYRTREEADALLPGAREVVDELARRVDPALFTVFRESLFIVREDPLPLAIFASFVLGFPERGLIAFRFNTDEVLEENLRWIVEVLTETRERLLNEPDPEADKGPTRLR